MNNTIRAFLAAAALIGFPLAVDAAEAPLPAQHHYRNAASVNASNLLEGVALNAAEAARTITLDLCSVPAGRNGGCWETVRLSVFYTYSAATTVVVTPWCSQDGTNYARETSRSISSGASAVYPFADTETHGGADIDFSSVYDVRGCVKYKFVLSGGGSPGAGDLVDAQASAYGG